MKIIVRGTNWIGDAVMTVPALTQLRLSFPDAHITLQSRPAAAAVFEGADFIDEVLLIKPARSKIAGILSQIRTVRRGKFDLGIIFTNSAEAAIVYKFGGVPLRFGYASGGRRILLNRSLPVPGWKNDRHEVYYYLELADSAIADFNGTQTGDRPEPDLRLRVAPTRLDRAMALMNELGIDPAHPIVALGVGSTNSRAKRWPAERFARLADRLATEINSNIVLVGSAEDRSVSTLVSGLTNCSPVDLCGKTTVSEAAAILASSDLLISNDMGLAHLAPAVGTPTIVIFGPTNENTTRPFSAKADIIRKVVECSPCMLRDCPIDHRCMTGVTVDDVFDFARNKLDLE